jgi:AraC-like DNA-binding protein
MFHSDSPPVVLLKFPGLSCAPYFAGPAQVMPTFVRHNDVGLNFVLRGKMQVLLSTGYRYVLEPGSLAVYWGAVPHRVEIYEPGTLLYWLAVPLGTFLQWRMPKGFTAQLMRGRVFFEPDDAQGPHDLALLMHWDKTISGGDAELLAVTHLELEARLRRLAHGCSGSVSASHRIHLQGSGSQAERMLLLVAEHFCERLSLADVATAVKLHPDYAGRLFRQHVGMGLNDYITECRLSHAKALLATSDAKMLDVAVDSGFGSVSRFHAVFKRLCGCTPRAYRESLRSTGKIGAK